MGWSLGLCHREKFDLQPRDDFKVDDEDTGDDVVVWQSLDGQLFPWPDVLAQILAGGCMVITQAREQKCEHDSN